MNLLIKTYIYTARVSPTDCFIWIYNDVQTVCPFASLMHRNQCNILHAVGHHPIAVCTPVSLIFEGHNVIIIIIIEAWLIDYSHKCEGHPPSEETGKSKCSSAACFLLDFSLPFIFTTLTKSAQQRITERMQICCVSKVLKFILMDRHSLS